MTIARIFLAITLAAFGSACAEVDQRALNAAVAERDALKEDLLAAQTAHSELESRLAAATKAARERREAASEELNKLLFPPKPDLGVGLPEPDAIALMRDRDGQELGEVQFWGAPTGVLVRAAVQGISPGYHGMHLHAAGACEPQTGFTTSGGHVMGGARHEHGFLNAKGAHEGDMPNIFVPEAGFAVMETFVPGVTLGAGPGGLGDADGAAVIIHDAPDDHTSQPIGGAGARIACGAVVPVN